MRMDQAYCLKVGVNDGGADEGHAPVFEVLGDDIAQGELLGRGLVDGFALSEGPDVVVEAGEFALDVNEGAGVVDGRLDFPLVADDAGVVHEGGNVVVIVGGDGIYIEVGKGRPKVFPLVEDGLPREACLKAF